MSSSVNQDFIVIQAGRKRPLLKSLIAYHELLLFLSWRDTVVRYKQMVLGLLWVVIRPILLMTVFTLLFGRVLNLQNQVDIPYPLIVFAGLLPWQFFSTSVQQISDSFVSNGYLISKVYFPRLILPLSTIVTGIIDFLVSMGVFALLMAWFRHIPDYKILYLPLFMLIFFTFSLGIGTFFASLNVTYRDFKYIIPFMLQLGFYASPVGFDLSVISKRWHLLYSLNPMVGIIEGFRWCLLGDHTVLYWPSVWVSGTVSIVSLCLGLKTFQAMERSFADKI